MTAGHGGRGPLPIIVPHQSTAKITNAESAGSVTSERKSILPHLLIWLPTLMLVAVWSLVAWVGLALAGWFGWAASEGGGTGSWGAWIDAFALPAWLTPWTPSYALESIRGMLATIGPMMESLAASKPDLLSGMMMLVVILWAVGALMLVLAGFAASIALVWRRRLPAQAAAR